MTNGSGIKRVGIVAATVVASLALVGGAYALGTTAAPTTKRDDLAAVTNPTGAPGRTLSLFRVTIPGKAVLATHRHPGTQVSRVEKGSLIYTVKKGVVPVYSGTGESPKLVRRIRAGQTGKIATHQWVVETPDDVHFVTNPEKGETIAVLSALLKTGEPPAIPVN